MGDNVVIDMSGSEYKLTQSILKAVQGFQGMEGGIKNVADASKKHAKEAEDGLAKLGETALGSLGKMASGLTAAVAAATVLKGAWEDIGKAAHDASSRAAADAPGLGSLALLAGGDRKKYAGYVKAAELFYKAGGADSAGEAAPAIKELIASGNIKDAEFFARLRGIGVQDSASLIRSERAIQGAYGSGSGNMVEIANQVLAAQRHAPGASAEGIAQAVARAGEGGAARGLKLDEAIGFITTVSGVAGGPEEAGSQLNQLLKAASKRGIMKPGMSVADLVTKLGGYSDAALAEMLPGGKAATDVVRFASSNVDTLRQYTKEEEFARGQDVAGEARSIASTDLVRQAARGMKQSIRKLNLASDPEGALESLYEDVKASEIARVANEGLLFQTMARVDWKISDIMTSVTHDYAFGIRGYGNAEQVDRLDKLEAASQNLDNAAGQMVAASRPTTGERILAGPDYDPKGH